MMMMRRRRQRRRQRGGRRRTSRNRAGSGGRVRNIRPVAEALPLPCLGKVGGLMRAPAMRAASRARCAASAFGLRA